MQANPFNRPARTADSAPVRFVDELYTGGIRGPEVYVTPEWWAAVMSGRGVTFAQFKAHECNAMSTTLGMFCGLLKPDAPHAELAKRAYMAHMAPTGWFFSFKADAIEKLAADEHFNNVNGWASATSLSWGSSSAAALTSEQAGTMQPGRRSFSVPAAPFALTIAAAVSSASVADASRLPWMPAITAACPAAAPA